MPKLDKIDRLTILNLSSSVGEGCINYKDDVMVVQAFLKYVLELTDLLPNFRLAEPNGTYTPYLGRLIRAYQRLDKRYYTTTKRLAADGIVSPANGENVPGTTKPWTIWLLNDEARYRYLSEGATRRGYINDLLDRFPVLIAVMQRSVGTLGLSLED